MSLPSITLLGPQRRQPDLVRVVDELRVDGPIGVISAGWQERELEVEELDQHLGRPTVNLGLFRRSEGLFTRHPELLEGLWRARAVLDQLQAAYAVQLTGALDAARALLAMDPSGVPAIIDYQDEAIEVVRQIDAHHYTRLVAAYDELEAEQRYDDDPDLGREREGVARTLDECAALLIAGGHVLVLLTRLRMFQIASRLGDRPVIAWSAGAMAASERIVLFHHSPPQGQNNTALAAPGLGLCSGIVPFPHASRRLEVDDPSRLSLLARRFAPDLCVAFDAQNRADWDGATWRGHGARRLTAAGDLEPLEVACP